LIRDYNRSDTPAIARLFYDTVHFVNRKDYSAQQIDAWAPIVPDVQEWHSRMSRRCTLVAEQHGQIIAFAELECDGHLDMFYCQKDIVRRGIGRSLYAAVELRAIGLGLKRIFVEASITARPFFERCGFSTLAEQTVARNGVALSNFRMEKQLQHFTHQV
jgi:N-acetylglutamate synthase-like GNAT family acetyltransferase